MNLFTVIIFFIFVSNISTLADEKDHQPRHNHGDERDKHDEHDEHGSAKSIGLGKAILKVDKAKGLKLSDEAIKTLNLTLKKVSTEVFSIDKDSLVVSKSMKGVYRFRDNFFKYLPVTSIKKVQGKYFVKVKGVVVGDQIVTGGVGLLRVTDVYSTDESEYGHGH